MSRKVSVSANCSLSSSTCNGCTNPGMRPKEVKFTAAYHAAVRTDHWMWSLIQTQFCENRKKSTTNAFRKCFILNCCWFEDGIIVINTFQFLSLSQVKSVHYSACVSSALTSPAAWAVWQKCEHTEAVEDAVSVWVQGHKCINSVLERGPTNICVKATMLCLDSCTEVAAEIAHAGDQCAHSQSTCLGQHKVRQSDYTLVCHSGTRTPPDHRVYFSGSCSMSCNPFADLFKSCIHQCQRSSGSWPCSLLSLTEGSQSRPWMRLLVPYTAVTDLFGLSHIGNVSRYFKIRFWHFFFCAHWDDWPYSTVMHISLVLFSNKCHSF